MEYRLDSYIEIPKIPCIYGIKSTVDSRLYIGSTTNALFRARGHQSHLKCGRHDNPRLQNFANKYGLSSLTFYIIEVCDIAQLLVREKYYIDTLNPHFNIIRDVMSRGRSAKTSEKAKQAIGNANRGIKNGNAKLNKYEVLEIRKSKDTCAVLSERYSISASQICMVRNYKSYKDITDEQMSE